MTTSLVIELECGSSSGRVHPHNGDWAGDFESPPRDTDPGGQHIAGASAMDSPTADTWDHR